MTVANEEWGIRHTIDKYEGGYSNDKGDPGGPTIYGITIGDWDEFGGGRVYTAEMVKAESEGDAVKIYEKKYVPGIRMDALPSGIDYACFDYGVHSGIGRPPRVLQTLLGLKVTGKMDQATLEAVSKVDQRWLVGALCDERDHFLRSIRGGVQYQRFPGWGARVKDIRGVCLNLIDGKLAPLPPRVPTTRTKPPSPPRGKHAPHPDVQRRIQRTTVGGTAATQAAHAFNSNVAIALGLGAVAVGGIAWLVYHQQIEQANQRVILPPGVTPMQMAQAGVVAKGG